MVIAPPSMRPGFHVPYCWINDAPIAEAPQWLIDLIIAKVSERSPAEPGPEPTNLSAGAEKIRAALAVTPSDAEQTWFEVGAGIGRVLGDADGFPLFDWWSRKSDKYDEDECAEKWEHLLTITGYGEGTIFHYADEADPNWRIAYEREQDHIANAALAELRASAADPQVHAMIMAEFDAGAKAATGATEAPGPDADETEQPEVADTPDAEEAEQQDADETPDAEEAEQQDADETPETEETNTDGNAYVPPVLLDPKDPMATARKIVAKRFTTAEGIRTLWRHRGTFWLWTGSYYRLADDETLRAQVWAFLETAIRRNGGLAAPFKPTRANVGEVIDAMTAICQLDEYLDPPCWISRAATMKPANELFACANGLLHLPTGKLYPPSPDYFCVSASTVTYDSKAAIPTQWLAFLKQLFDDDKEAIETLQDLYGYLLSPDTSQQKIGGIIGPKRSGKGTIARILTKLLGATSVAGPTMNSLGQNFGLEDLITKSLAVVSDVRIGKHTDKSTIVERLLSISGEDRMSVPRKFLRAWNGKLPTRIILLTNEMPALTDGSGALAGRLIILILTESFYGREDPKLTDKLATELSGILNWAIKGYRRLNKRGSFIQPASGKAAVADIEMLGAPVKAFIRDKCTVGPGMTVPVNELFDTWRNRCVYDERRDVGSKEWFGRNLHAAVPGLSITRPRGGDQDRERTYQGIGLRS
jgi:putative DNA primase/helicase